MGLRKKSSRLFRKNLSVLLSATMLVGSVSMTDGLTANAEEAAAGYSVSGSDTVSEGDAVSGGDLRQKLLLAPQALTALGRSVAGTASYADFTADEVIYSLNFGTDVTKETTYAQRTVGSETVGIGFADEEYKNEATGWSGGVYYPRTVSRQEPGAGYVVDGDGYLQIASQVWTETESTGYGVYTYENTSKFSMELANADYSVEVTFVNPTGDAYSAYIESEEITKVTATEIGAGATETVSYTACLVDGVLDIKFLAASDATSEGAAASKNVYVKSLKVTRLATNEAESKPTIFIASDSTVQTYDDYYRPCTGWGETLHQFFGDFVEERECDNCNYSQAQTYETANVVIENRAIGGRSSSSFVLEGKLDDLLEDVKPGDFLLLQWGHNDATAARPNRYVASSEFEKWIQYYVDGAIQRGATPVLVTPVARYSYTTDSDGKLVSYASNFESYRQVMVKMSQEQGIALVDLTQRSIDVANSFGIDGGKSLWLWVNAGDYPDGAYAGGATDSTHLQYYGAYKFGQCVAKGIAEASTGSSPYENERSISGENQTALSGLAAYVSLNEATQAPAKVTGVTAGTVGASSVSMSWDAAENAEMYYVYRAAVESVAAGEAYVFDDTAEKYSVSASTKYVDSGCAGGTTYVYAIRGFNSMGLGDYSDNLVVTTKSAGYRFDFNYNSSATQDGWIGINQNQLYDAGVGYGWAADAYPNNGRHRGNNGTVSDDLADMAADFCMGEGTFCVDLPNGDYELTIYAADLLAGTSTIKASYWAEDVAIGGISCKQSLGSLTTNVRITDGQLNLAVGGSNAVISGLTITEILKAPTALVATEASVAGMKYSFLLGYTGIDEAASYKVWQKGTSDADFGVVKSYTVEEYAADELGCRSMSVDLGETYQFYVTAVTADGTESAPSNTITVEALLDTDAPAAPTNVICTDPLASATTLSDHVTISWDASVVSDSRYPVIKYIIYRSAKAEGEKGFVQFDKIGEATTTSYTDDTVKTNIPYYYKVAAMNAGGISGLSEVCATPVTGSLTRVAEETLTDRALVAVKLSDTVKGYAADGSELTDGVYLSWRAFDEDFDKDNNLTTTFTVYVNGAAVATAKDVSVTNMVLTGVAPDAVFTVVGSNDSSVNGGLRAVETRAWDNQYVELSLNRPADQTMPDATVATYVANDMSLGDVDADGVLELIVKWYPSNAQDNSSSGYTGTTILDTYDVDWVTGQATMLSRIDLGVNIRSGAHYTQFQVWDYDGDGKAEVAIKTADGTTSYDGSLNQVDYVGECPASSLPTETVSAANDYRNSGGYVLDGPEYFSIFNLEDGTKAAEDVAYVPGRGTVSKWGDGYGGRVDRFLAATAYLDGEHAFAVMCRGYYTRTALTAYGMKDTNGDGIGDVIFTYWAYDTDNYGGANEGQGNHNLAVADVDNDGKDEIVYGSSCYDHDGTLKYSTGLGHGDAMHISDWVDWNDGLEVMEVHEEKNQTYQVEIHDAETGKILIGYPVADTDVGRGVASDIDPTSLGAEFWASKAPDGSGDGEWDSVNSAVLGTQNSDTTKWDYLSRNSTPAVNGTIFWDGDLLAEIQDHRFDYPSYISLGVVIADWDYVNSRQVALIDSAEILSNNGSKGNLGIVADFLGDWREEFIARCAADASRVRVYTTTYVTDYVVPCLLEDLQYREGVAWENVAYNQPTHTSYLLSKGLVTAQLAEGKVLSDQAELLFTPANDGTLYGHEVTGYEIYRAEGDGDYTLLTSAGVSELTKKSGSGSSQTPDENYGVKKGSYLFDFGAGEVATGYTQVTAADKYTSTKGYGFADLTGAGDYSQTTWGTDNAALYGDSVLFYDKTTDHKEFAVDVPNGTYSVTYSIAGNNYFNAITAEGSSIETNKFRVGAGGALNTVTAEVTVEDGQLNLVATISKANYFNIYFTEIRIEETDSSFAARVAAAKAAWEASQEESGSTFEGEHYSYVDSTVSADTTYRYKIAAIVDGRTSFESRELTVQTAIEIESVIQPDPVELVEGTPIAADQTLADLLPETVKVVAAGGAELDASITWDVTGLDINTVGTYTVEGTIKGHSEKVSLTVNVVANAVKGYTPLEEIVSVVTKTVTLPENVTLEYTNTTTATKNVTWNTEELDINTVGVYEVQGTVEGMDDYVTVTVRIVDNYIASVATSYVEIAYGEKTTDGKLPATVAATWANDAVTDVAVVWNAEEAAAVDTATLGTYTVTGTVEGYTGTVTLQVIVNYAPVYAFDFGIDESAVAEGYTPVTVNARGGSKTFDELGITYSEEKGYGFLNGTEACDGRQESFTCEGVLPASFYTDFALPAGHTFVVDLPNGNYKVDLVGASYYKSTAKANIEGIAASIGNAAGSYAVTTVDVELTDGQLTVEFTTGNVSRVAGLIIRKVASAEEPGGATPTPGAATPTPGGATPTPGGATPTPGGATPTPGAATPTPAPGAATPTPAPGAATPTPTAAPVQEDDADDDSQSSSGSQEMSGEELDAFWLRVNRDEIDQLEQMSRNGQQESRNLNVVHTGETKVPAYVLNTIRNSRLTLAIHSGDGITLSISGRDLEQIDLTGLQGLDLTVDTHIRSIPENVASSKSAEESRQFTVRDTGSFAVPVNLHVNVGSDKAGKYVNLYRYNREQNTLEYCGSYPATESGQAMFSLASGGSYLTTVTAARPQETLLYSGAVYTVQRGDTLSAIAVKTRVALRQLLGLNSWLGNGNLILPGQKIRLK